VPVVSLGILAATAFVSRVFITSRSISRNQPRAYTLRIVEIVEYVAVVADRSAVFFGYRTRRFPVNRTYASNIVFVDDVRNTKCRENYSLRDLRTARASPAVVTNRISGVNRRSGSNPARLDSPAKRRRERETRAGSEFSRNFELKAAVSRTGTTARRTSV